MTVWTRWPHRSAGGRSCGREADGFAGSDPGDAPGRLRPLQAVRGCPPSSAARGRRDGADRQPSAWCRGRSQRSMRGWLHARPSARPTVRSRPRPASGAHRPPGLVEPQKSGRAATPAVGRPYNCALLQPSYSACQAKNRQRVQVPSLPRCSIKSGEAASLSSDRRRPIRSLDQGPRIAQTRSRREPTRDQEHAPNACDVLTAISARRCSKAGVAQPLSTSAPSDVPGVHPGTDVPRQSPKNSAITHAVLVSGQSAAAA